ncbi:MAG: hypothetical protein K5866_04110 [Treponema sp.]|nr:hypothetical protein [Treponema sp.]
MKRYFTLFTLCLFIGVITSCSNVINMIMAPFAPDFEPTVKVAKDGAHVICSLDINKVYSETDPKEWEQGYAVYVWRSTTNPYQDYELVARVYNSSAIGNYTGYTSSENGTSYVSYDYTLDTSDELNIMYKGGNMDLLDITPLSTTCYYRTSVLTLECSHTETDTSESISYNLNQETSGWVQVEKITSGGDSDD